MTIIPVYNMLLVPSADHFVRTSLYRRLTGKLPEKDEKVTLIVTRQRQKPDELTEDNFYPIGLTGVISEVNSGGYIVIRTGYRVNIEHAAVTPEKKIDLIAGLGFNMNLAPDIDLANEYNQIMFSRSLCGDANITAKYAEFVTKKSQAKGVSVTLKHFPGYGTIPDSYEPIVTDTRDAETIRTVDWIPFKSKEPLEDMHKAYEDVLCSE